MSIEQVVTYIIAPLLTGFAAVWAVWAKLIPRLVEAKLQERQKRSEAEIEERRDEREYRQTTGNRALDILQDYARDINTERAKEVDRLTAAIERNTAAVEQSARTIEGAMQANTKAVERQGQQVENNGRSVTTLAGAIDLLREKIGSSSAHD